MLWGEERAEHARREHRRQRPPSPGRQQVAPDAQAREEAPDEQVAERPVERRELGVGLLQEPLDPGEQPGDGDACGERDRDAIQAGIPQSDFS
jgi:hypothetical protein